MNLIRANAALSMDGEELPFGPAQQQRVEASLGKLLGGHHPAALLGVRTLVVDSWTRSRDAGVERALCSAPLVWDEGELERARERTEWLPVAVQAIYAQCTESLEAGHILTLFDEGGRMLSAQGDAAAREGLADINFRPGALWTEAAAGTNGPGTALALGRPVHVVGAEHFCERWQGWHCAATPVRDPATGAIIAVVDISGYRDRGHPHTLALTAVIAAAIEQRLVALDAERRVLLLQRFAELSGRWPGETLVAVDRGGALLASTKEAPASLVHLARSPRLRALLDLTADKVRAGGPQELPVPLAGGLVALCQPIFDGPALAGSCLVVQRPAPPRAPARTGARAQQGQTRYSLDDVLGKSAAIKRALSLARAAAANTLPVLITGESGTGKEVFAQGIHARSARAGNSFVAVNCASLSRELVESEFFGYVGGAFSGARREGSIGKFEAADGGTLFLDEIAELSCDAQAKLLRVLQEEEFVPVGGAHPRPIDVRIIAATNRDIAACLRSGALREDLFHRLNVLAIPLPPLRERAQDTLVLVESFLAAAQEEQGKSGLVLTPSVARAFEGRTWPGNVRELKNVVRRMVALSEDGLLSPADLPSAYEAAAEPPPTPPAQAASPAAPPSEDDVALSRLLDTVAAARTMTEAASLLGVTRSTLYRQLARRGIRSERVLRQKV